ncbi:MAG TPA: 16S rRNA (adenine(1518)-N(6)/adenine(1519)-N(6))-dimethyltransferase RsmA [Myxococcaceae bacterium]|nr:16S rRNA (adenine(1518)-N(6)/adenine(1519)-N(6))-dimethyltransferase RsmA [Myxococcaceae bacterium]
MDSPRRMLEQHGLRPKHAWGQNFLDDPAVLADIVRAARLGPDSTVVELGAGLGHLTSALLETGAKVVAVERDRELVAVLERLQHPRLTVLAANAARIALASVAGTRPLTLVGNLPYHLTSSILFEALEQQGDLTACVFTVQKEVADRVAAGEGTRAGGLLTVLLGVWFDASIVRMVPRGAFHPPPKVDSAVLLLEHRAEPRAEVGDEAFFRRVVKAGFSQRRKTLANALQSDRELGEVGRIRAALAEAGIEAMRRAETLSVGDFARLARALRQPPGHG